MVVDSVIVAVLDDHPEVIATYLFGSRGRGDASPRSDVDLAILFAGDGPDDPFAGMGLRVSAEIERRLKCPVDVVVLDRAPPALVHRVLRDGRLLVDREPERRVRFEVDARNRYFDLAPVVRAYREAAP